MKILVTNDDGIFAPGLWTLVRELRNIAEVIVVAPDREQSAIGTAITLHHPLRVQKVSPPIRGVKTYAVGGTPADSVIMGLSKLAGKGIDLVISGINNGPNLGDDVLISGTVGGALQGYLHGLSAIAISVDGVESPHLDNVAKFTALLTRSIKTAPLQPNIFLNVNVPSLPLEKIKGVKVTRLSTTGYADTVEEGHDGRREYYWLKHQKATQHAGRFTDAWAVARNHISITPLHTHLFGKTQPILNGQLTGLLAELKRYPAALPEKESA